MGRKNTVEDIWKKIDKSGGPLSCWPWVGCTSKSGYGKTFFEGKDWRTHRLIWFFETGFKPEVVMHKCDNPQCCNPIHLQAGTIALNNLDRLRKGRSAKQKGELHGLSKLTERDVLSIRRTYAQEQISYAEIGRRFGIRRETARDIVVGRRWKHLPLTV